MTDYEWGPWIDHDGKGCPCIGKYVRVKLHSIPMYEGIAWGEESAKNRKHTDPLTSKWAWLTNRPTYGKVIRYQVRIPRGMTMLTNILREVEKNKNALVIYKEEIRI